MVAQTSPQQPYYDSSTYYGDKDTNVSHISEVAGEGKKTEERAGGLLLVLLLQEVLEEEGEKVGYGHTG